MLSWQPFIKTPDTEKHKQTKQLLSKKNRDKEKLKSWLLLFALQRLYTVLTIMSNELSDYVNVSMTADSTPLKLRNPAIENAQDQSQYNHKKRAPSTPLTPTLIQKNIIKKQQTALPSYTEASHKTHEEVEVFERASEAKDGRSLSDEFDQQENEENYMFLEQQRGSPKSKKATSASARGEYDSSISLTPKITAGIKMAVKEQKKSRLQILRNSETAERSFSESEYSEVSTIAGGTPNYRIQEDLVYYKNGYYINGNDDSFFDHERENLINAKELTRVNDLLEFMTLEREFSIDKLN